MMMRMLDEQHVTQQVAQLEAAQEQRKAHRRGAWTEPEDELLRSVLQQLATQKEGSSKWSTVASFVPGRTAKQCRERWCYNLDPSISKEPWSEGEDAVLLETHRLLGNRWAHIASRLPGRTENAVKTRFKSLARAKRREWTPEEDRIIMAMHRRVGSKWELIAQRLENRTKNAVKTRYRSLSRGEAGNPSLMDENNPDVNISEAEMAACARVASRRRSSLYSPRDNPDNIASAVLEGRSKRSSVFSTTSQRTEAEPRDVGGALCERASVKREREPAARAVSFSGREAVAKRPRAREALHDAALSLSHTERPYPALRSVLEHKPAPAPQAQSRADDDLLRSLLANRENEQRRSRLEAQSALELQIRQLLQARTEREQDLYQMHEQREHDLLLLSQQHQQHQQHQHQHQQLTRPSYDALRSLLLGSQQRFTGANPAAPSTPPNGSLHAIYPASAQTAATASYAGDTKYLDALLAARPPRPDQAALESLLSLARNHRHTL